MSLVLQDVTPYLKTVIGGLKLFKYVNKPYDQSIPSTSIDRSYTIVFNGITGLGKNSVAMKAVSSVKILLYRSGFQYEDIAREESAKDSERIVKACISVANSNTKTGIKNVTMRSIEIDPMAGNDNITVTSIFLDVTFFIDPNN